MHKSCYQLLHEFNQIASGIDPDIQQKIFHGQPIAATECIDPAIVKTAVEIWNDIQTRMNLIPQYDLMVQ